MDRSGTNALVRIQFEDRQADILGVVSWWYRAIKRPSLLVFKGFSQGSLVNSAGETLGALDHITHVSLVRHGIANDLEGYRVAASMAIASSSYDHSDV